MIEKRWQHKTWHHKNLKESIIGAFKGIKIVFSLERNARIIIIIGVAVLILGFLLDASRRDFAMILLTIVAVFACETFNTVIEVILDMIHPQDDPHVKILKDISSGVVMLASVCAAIVGATIFIPKIEMLLRQF